MGPFGLPGQVRRRKRPRSTTFDFAGPRLISCPVPLPLEERMKPLELAVPIAQLPEAS